jgi:hypothetical protein
MRRELKLKLTVYFYRLCGGHNVVFPVVVIADLVRVELAERSHAETYYLVDSCLPWQCATPENDFPGLRIRRCRSHLREHFTIPLVPMYGHPHPHRGSVC